MASKRSDAYGSAEERAKNVRQRLLRAHRQVNALVSVALARRGFDDIRPVHARLLENLDRDGNSISDVAKRAVMTKQAMGLLAKELEAKGYIARQGDESDRRVWRLGFTARGWNLMVASFEIVAEIERRVQAQIGVDEFATLRLGLDAIGTLSDAGTKIKTSRKKR